MPNSALSSLGKNKTLLPSPESTGSLRPNLIARPKLNQLRSQFLSRPQLHRQFQFRSACSLWPGEQKEWSPKYLVAKASTVFRRGIQNTVPQYPLPQLNTESERHQEVPSPAFCVPSGRPEFELESEE